MNFGLITLFKIFSIIVLVLLTVAFFTVVKREIMGVIQRKKALNVNYDQISSLYFLFSLITSFIGMLITVYLKLAITGTFDIFIYNP